MLCVQRYHTMGDMSRKNFPFGKVGGEKSYLSTWVAQLVGNHSGRSVSNGFPASDLFCASAIRWELKTQKGRAAGRRSGSQRRAQLPHVFTAKVSRFSTLTGVRCQNWNMGGLLNRGQGGDLRVG